MGRGKRRGGTRPDGAGHWPALLPGDFVLVDSDDAGFIPLEQTLAEVQAVEEDGRQLSLIVGGRMFTTVDWADGDRWEKTLPPEDLPVSWLRSQAAPSEGLKTAHSYLSRPEPAHPLVLATGAGEWNGWLNGEAVGEVTALLGVADDVWDRCYNYGSAEGWEEQHEGSLDGLDPVLVRKAAELGQLLCEADCMNDGFILHTYTPNFELRLYSAEDRKGLEAVIELMEELGVTLTLEPEDDGDEESDS